MRNALILLVVVALVIVTAGAVNHSVAFDVDWVAGTLRAVSLLWVAAAIALVVLLAGLAAALLARRGAVRTQRKLETELDVTYRRVRELESLAPASAAAAVAPAGVTSASMASAPAQTAVQASSASTTATLAPEVASTAAAAAVAAQTPGSAPPAVAETTVTVVAAHGSARVTQVLPAPAEPDAGESTPVQPQAGESKSVELGADETVAGAATAVTRSHGDPAAPNASDDPDVSAADAAGGEAAPPD